MTYKHQCGLRGTQSKESRKTGCGKGAIPAPDALARDSLAQYGDYLASYPLPQSPPHLLSRPCALEPTNSTRAEDPSRELKGKQAEHDPAGGSQSADWGAGCPGCQPEALLPSVPSTPRFPSPPRKAEPQNTRCLDQQGSAREKLREG